MYCIVTGSCRPFQLSALLHYEFRAAAAADDDDDDDDVRGKYISSLSEQSFYLKNGAF